MAAGKASRFFADVVAGSKPRLALFMKYAKVELIPPKPNEIGQVVEGFKNLVGGLKSSRWQQLTIKEAWLNTLVATEVACWFFVGEIIGRRHFVGYEFRRPIPGHH